MRVQHALWVFMYRRLRPKLRIKGHVILELLPMEHAPNSLTGPGFLRLGTRNCNSGYTSEIPKCVKQIMPKYYIIMYGPHANIGTRILYVRLLFHFERALRIHYNIYTAVRSRVRVLPFRELQAQRIVGAVASRSFEIAFIFICINSTVCAFDSKNRVNR